MFPLVPEVFATLSHFIVSQMIIFRKKTPNKQMGEKRKRKTNNQKNPKNNTEVEISSTDLQSTLQVNWNKTPRN